jgi:hypothetical protein
MLSVYEAAPKTFSPSEFLLNIPTSEHDAILEDDILYELHLNSEWRGFIANAITTYLEAATHAATAVQLDTIEPFVANLFDDFYNKDSLTVPLVAVASNTAGQSLTALAENYIVWDEGDYDVANPTRLSALGPPPHIVTAQWQCKPNTGTTAFVVKLILGAGVTVAAQWYQIVMANQVGTLSYIEPANDTYYRLSILPANTAQLASTIIFTEMRIMSFST